MAMTRRQFLRGTTALAAATWGSAVWRPGLVTAHARTLAAAVAPELTTLAVSLALDGDVGYRRLVEIPGWPLEVRGDLAEPRAGREDRRTALATIVHLTDVHVIDAQSPARVEFLDRYADQPTQSIPFSSAWRPQETLSGHVADAMIRRLRRIGRGPVTGRGFDIAVSTGDNTDNQQANELDWFLTVLNGGAVAVNSGDPDRYEGVQHDDVLGFDDHYWHPDEVVHPVTSAPDAYKRVHGFPDVPGLLAAAIAPFDALGLPMPWYSCYGNHDGLLQGNAPAVPPLDTIATGPLKIVGLPAGMSPNDFAEGLASGDPATLGALLGGPARLVTADPERRPISPTEWVQAHLDVTTGPGPVGHGYDAENLATGRLYYTFDIGDGVFGICLDTVNRGGYADGSIGQEQLDWLEEQLVAVHRRYFDPAGSEVRTEHDDRLVVLFSHHNLETLANPLPDPSMPADARILGTEFEAFLHRFPNVIAWLNGHSHVNRVWARPDGSGRTGGFWEINTAAHIDAPQHARIVEIADNGDGTLSIFGTLIDHDAPAVVAYDARDPMALASLSRELSWNDPQAGLPSALGTPGDRNVELVLTRPFAPVVDGGPPGGGATPAPVPTPAPAPAPALPATGGGAGLLVGAAAIGAAAVAARRDRGDGE
jgi:metallophosphoesterase (TIGR03767 family)